MKIILLVALLIAAHIAHRSNERINELRAQAAAAEILATEAIAITRVAIAQLEANRADQARLKRCNGVRDL